jgi:hypothetical protein
VNNPGNPDTDFQQHKVMGTFSIDMKAAQVASSNSGGSGSATTGTTAPSGSSPSETSNSGLIPTITGGVAPVLDIGLTQRDKVLYIPPFLSHRHCYEKVY